MARRALASVVAIAALAPMGLTASVTRAAAAAPREGTGLAGPPNTGALYAPLPGIAGLPSIDPALALVSVDSPAYRRANSSYQTAAVALTSAQHQRAAAERALADLNARSLRLDAGVAIAAGRQDAARAALTEVVSAIQQLAVDAYMTAGDLSELSLTLQVRPAIEPEKRRVLGSASLATLLHERQRNLDALVSADLAHRSAAADRAAVAKAIATTTAARDRGAAAELAHGPEVAGLRGALEQARVLAKVRGADFQLVAMDAYYRAAKRSNERTSACGIEWWGLAGISKVEGRHGTYGGSELEANGDTTQKIIGIPLNGASATSVIADTDGGALDGDPNFDRAVGPMQFIPSTWKMVASDGNDDAVKNPHNIYDAALAAGAYLCRASRGLADDPGLRAAYFSYNHSDPYVANVLSWARAYQRLVIPKI